MKVEITTERTASGFLVRVKGDVDMNTSPDVRTTIGEAFREGGARALLIDLAGVRYMDSSGIATLVEAMQNCRKQNMRFRLVDLSPPVRDVFEMARLSSIFEVFPSAHDALAGL
jgi:anti-sigma B factor antagonist